MKIWVLFSNAPRRVPVFTPQVLIVFLAEEAPTVLVPLLPFEVLRHLGKQSGSSSLLLFAGESETSGLVFQSGFETQVGRARHIYSSTPTASSEKSTTKVVYQNKAFNIDG